MATHLRHQFVSVVAGFDPRMYDDFDTRWRPSAARGSKRMVSGTYGVWARAWAHGRMGVWDVAMCHSSHTKKE